MTHARNPGLPLTTDWFDRVQVNRPAAERRAATLTTRRSVKKEHQAAWLVNAIRCTDLTTLAGDDTPGNVHRLVAKAITPLRQDILEALGMGDQTLHVGAVCVYHSRIQDALDALNGVDIPIAAVSTGFPAGQSPYKQRIEEIHESVAAGAKEIDIVISREHVLRGDWGYSGGVG